jgi:hypothetical protein
MTTSAQLEPSVTPSGVTARDITAALRTLYPDAKITCRANPDGTATVRLPALCARYLGVGRDSHQVAAWVSVYAPYGVQVISATPDDCAVTLARQDAKPADPRTSAGVPTYATTEQVTGEWPANRQVTGLITLAIDAGCRPHIDPQRSPHGHRYRVGLWHVDPELLHGVIDVMEESGRFAGAWYSWGRDPERQTGDPREIRQQLASARDLHRAQTAAGDAHRLARAEFPASAPPRPSLQARHSGPEASRRRTARTTSAAQQGHPRSLP